MPKKERQAKAAAFAMMQELDSEMTEEQRQRMEKSGMGVGGGLNKGEDILFGAWGSTAEYAPTIAPPLPALPLDVPLAWQRRN